MPLILLRCLDGSALSRWQMANGIAKGVQGLAVALGTKHYSGQLECSTLSLSLCREDLGH